MREQPSLVALQDRHDLGLDRLAGYVDVFVADVNVDLVTNAEFAFEINAGLNREENARGDEARVARLEVVDVHAVAMAFFADRVARAMGELLTVACAFDHAA